MDQQGANSYSVKLNLSLLVLEYLSLDLGYFGEVLDGPLHVFPAPPLHGLDAELPAALDNPDVVLSDWNVLPLDRVSWHEHVISHLNRLFFVLFDHEAQVLHLALSDDGGRFGLLVPWGGLLGLGLRLVDHDSQLFLDP